MSSNIGFRCHFLQHDKTMLIGSDPSHIGDRCIRVTIHHCFFDGTKQRHPRVRYGKVHLYNNYTRNWGIYAVCASVESQVLFLLTKFYYLLVWTFKRFQVFSYSRWLKILYLYCDIRYTPNAIYMKQDKRGLHLNISQRRYIHFLVLNWVHFWSLHNHLELIGFNCLRA